MRFTVLLSLNLVFIRVTWHEHHNLSNYRHIDCLFKSLFRLTTKNTKASRYRSFLREVHRHHCLWSNYIIVSGPVKKSLRWRHNEHDSVSNHQHHDCWLNRLFRQRSKKISKLRVTGLCEGNSPVTGEFPAQRTSNAEKDSIWWRHHEWRIWTYAKCESPHYDDMTSTKPLACIMGHIVSAAIIVRVNGLPGGDLLPPLLT